MNILFQITQWSILFKHEPLQNMWMIFTTNYDNIVQQCTPEYIRRTKIRKPWRRARVKRQCALKQKKWNQYFTTNRYIDDVEYTQQNNKTINVIRGAKADFKNKLIKNYKPFYKYMRSKQIIKPTARQLEQDDGTLTADDSETANNLQDFFISVFTGEDITNTPDIVKKQITVEIKDILIRPDDVL